MDARKPTILININAADYTGDGEGVTAHGDRAPAHVVRRLAETPSSNEC